MSKTVKKSKKKKIDSQLEIKQRKEKNKKININPDKQANLKKIIIYFLISRVILLVFLIAKGNLSIFELYDGSHYIEMASSGYSHPYLYAFFPLYPILIKILYVIIPSYNISGAIISNLCSFLSLLILHDMTKDKENLKYIICFIFTPILAYTTIVYTESLFMFLTLLGYYLYKKDKYILSAIVVGLSILTRNSGIILWGAIGLDMLYRLFITKEKSIKFKNILSFGLIALLIGMIYPTYLYIKTGNFLEFASVQYEYWFRETGNFIDSIYKDIKVLIRNPKTRYTNMITFIQNWGSFFLTLLLSIKIFKKDKVSSIYIIVSLIAFTSTYRDINVWEPLSSISLFRYVLNLFPIYLYLFDNKKESINKLILLTFFSLSIFNSIVIYAGKFIG